MKVRKILPGAAAAAAVVLTLAGCGGSSSGGGSSDNGAVTQEKYCTRPGLYCGLVLLTAIDETFSQTVHSRSSYGASEVVWGARFAPLFKNDDGSEALDVDMSRFHTLHRVPLQLSE